MKGRTEARAGFAAADFADAAAALRDGRGDRSGHEAGGQQGGGEHGGRAMPQG